MRPITLLRDIWRHRRGLPNQPRFLTYIVSFRCNARCVMCDCWKKPSPGELTLPEIEAVFAQLPRLDAVRLSGGEPFLRPDFPQIAALALERLQPRFLHVTTNGFLTRRVVEFCERRPRSAPLVLLVSLDGTEAKHNEVRGRPRAWEQAFATVRELAPRQKELGLRLQVNQTIVDHDGLEEHRKLRALLEPMGVPVNAVVAYATSATYSLQAEAEAAPTAPGEFTTFGDLSRGLANKLLTELEAGLAGRRWTERLAKRYYLAGLRSRLLDRKASPNPSCVALSSHLRLLPNGDVPVCQFNTRTVGNLRRQRLDAVWASEPIRRERAWVRRCAGCWAECEVLPNALYSGDGIRQALHSFTRRGLSQRQTDSPPREGGIAGCVSPTHKPVVRGGARLPPSLPMDTAVRGGARLPPSLPTDTAVRGGARLPPSHAAAREDARPTKVPTTAPGRRAKEAFPPSDVERVSELLP